MNPEKTLYVARAAIWRTRAKEQLLLAQRPDGMGLLPRSKNYPGAWEFPGGKIDGDENYSIAGAREAVEETRLQVIRYFQPDQLALEYVMSDEDSPYVGWLIKTWVIEALAFRPDSLTQDPPEHNSLEWLTIEEALQRKLNPQTTFAFPFLRQQQNILRSLQGLDPLPPIELG